MAIGVRESAEELADCANVGLSRNRGAIKEGKKDRSKPHNATDEEIHILGAQGEYAFCKATNRVWTRSIGTYGKVPDCPDSGGIEVKTCRSTSKYLKIKQHEWNKEQCHVLVEKFGKNLFIVHGWIGTTEGKKIGELCDPGNKGRPLYKVLPEQLHSPEELVVRYTVHASRIRKTA